MIRKIISLFLAFTFSFYNLSFAITEEKNAPPTSVTTKGPLSVEDIGIAIDSGTIRSKFSGNSGKTIVHIQDAHCNFEAQSNINKMLDQLTKECGIDIISVEGAEGIVDTAWFRAFPDAEIRKEVATYFMKKGEITGAEFFSINSDYNGTIFGAETRDYYVKNLKSFTDVYPYKEAMEKYFKDLKDVANRLKSIVYGPRLREFDSKMKAFESKELELSDYADYLNKLLSNLRIDVKTDAPNFTKLLQTLEYEDKINFDTVDAERSNYIDAISKKLTKEKMTELVSESIKFKKGHIKAVDFYSYLRELAKELKIDMVHDYPNLYYYYIYTKLYEGIDNEGLFKEIAALERRLKDKLFENDTQRKLDKYAETISMFIDLINIELTNEDYDIYKGYAKEFAIEDVLNFITKLCSQYNLNCTIDTIPPEISENIPHMVDFYEIAMIRDNALIENTLKEMEKNGKDRCVLIAGGFHTKGIKDILEKKGVSYVVVTPKITKDVETPYIKVLTNQRTSLEDIITESAAIPAVGIKEREEKYKAQDEEFLAPLYIVGYSISLELKDPTELRRLSDQIGAVKDGETLEEATTRRFKEIVAEVVNTWLRKVEENADPAVWAEVETKWEVLLSAYFMKYEESGIKLNDRIKPIIREVFEARFRDVITHKKVNKYIKEHLPSGLASDKLEVRAQNLARYSLTENYGVSAHVIPIRGLHEATGLKAHIGLGQMYGEPVIYVDEHLSTPEVLNHELYEISQWNKKLEELREKGLVSGPKDMREWIKNNIQEARILAKQFHDEANRSEESKVKDHSPDAVMRIYADPTDVILAARPAAKKQADRIKMENVAELNRIVRDSEGASEVLAITNGGDDGIVKRILEVLRSKIFRRDGSVRIEAYPETIRRGQFFGLLDAMKAYGAFNKDKVSLGIMMPGKGTRMSPFTQATFGIKPLIPMLIRTDKDSDWLSGATASLYTWNLVAHCLEKKGFRGIAWKWGDEPQVASNSMKTLVDSKIDLSNADIVRFGSRLLVTDDLAKNKEWLNADADGNLTGWARRRERPALLRRLGIEDTPQARAYTHIGSPAFSYLFIETAMEVFKDYLTDAAKRQVWMDVDGYLMEALTLSDTDWQAEVTRDKDLRDVLTRCPEFRERCQDIRKRINIARGNPENAPLVIKVIDFGPDLYWADIGQLQKARASLYEVAQETPEGEFARKLAALDDIKRDKFNNIVAGECIYPQDGSVRNSVLINAKIYGIANIDSAVIVDSELGNAFIKKGGVVFASTVIMLAMAEDAFSYNSVAEVVDIAKGWVHTSMPKDVSEIAKGLDDWYADSSKDVGSKDYYEKARFGNPRSFEEQQNIMRQRKISPEDIARAINEFCRIPLRDRIAKELTVLKERAKRYEYSMRSFYEAKMGTSGVRGVAMAPDSKEEENFSILAGDVDLPDQEVYLNFKAQFEYAKRLKEQTGLPKGPLGDFIKKGVITQGDILALIGDLRPTTPRILVAIAVAAIESGLKVDFQGLAPTPALANYAVNTKGTAGVMVTASHNPYSMNGAKTYWRTGEFLKPEEEIAAAYVAKSRGETYFKTAQESMFDDKGMFKKPEELSPEQRALLLAAREAVAIEKVKKEKEVNIGGKPYNLTDAEHSFLTRFTQAFPGKPLAGKKIVFYEQSSVGRYIIPIILEVLGATVIREEPSDVFIPIDTENISDKAREKLRELAQKHKPFAVVSTDGDSDRPIFCDENGEFLHGDKLGVVTSLYLGLDYIVTTASANSRATKMLQDRGITVVRTKVGSPYVIEQMFYEGAKLDGKKRRGGFEVNGGFLLDSEIDTQQGGKLAPLATRDSVLPIISAMFWTIQLNKDKISDAINQTFQGYESYSQAGLVENTLDKLTPGCESYTAEMGPAIVKSFSPKDTKIEEVDIDQTGRISYRLKDQTEFKLAEGEALQNIADIKARLERYLKRITKLEKESIAKIEYIDGVRIYMTNNEIIHLRPSGNAAQFRIYTEAATQDRANEIVKQGTKENTGILIQIIQDFSRGAKTGRERSIERLREMLENNEPITITSLVKTGKEGYTWGQKLHASRIFELKGAKTLKEKRTLAERLGVSPKRETPDKRVVEQEIAEEWIAAGVIDLGPGYEPLPLKEALRVFGNKILGERHVTQFGNSLALTVKRLAGGVSLSLQYHRFRESIIPTRDGTAIVGLSRTVTKEEFIEAIRRGDTSIFNLVPVKVGVPLVVEPYIIHAYVDMSLGDETKAVTPEEDAAGTVSFYDRLKWGTYPPEKKEDAEKLLAQVLAGGAQAKEALTQLVANGYVREKKDFLTLPQERTEATPKDVMTVGEIAQELESQGGLQRTVAPRQESAPKQSGYSVVLETPEYGVGLFRLEIGESINVSENLPGKFHFLVAGEGTIGTAVIRDGEEITKFSGGGSAVRYAAQGNYTITAQGGPVVVYVHYRNVPESTHVVSVIGEEERRNMPKVPGTNEPIYDEKVVYNTDGSTSDQIRILDQMESPGIVDGRQHALIIQEGSVRLEKLDGTLLGEIKKGERLVIKGDVGKYRLVKTSSEAAVVKIDYDKIKEEDVTYSIYDTVRRRISEIQAAGQIDLILPSEMFVPGGKDVVGSSAWEQEQLQKFVSDKIRITTYSAHSGLTDAAKRVINKGATAILVATKPNIDRAGTEVSEEDRGNVRKFLYGEKGKLRVLAIPDIEGLQDQGWYYNRDIIGTALLLGALKPEEIQNKEAGSVADDLKNLIGRITNKEVPWEHLYCLLSKTEIPDTAFEYLRINLTQNPYGWLSFLVQNLLLSMPIKPFTDEALGELNNRRKVMWSV